MDQYLSVIAKRLSPNAVNMNVYRDEEGNIGGWLLDMNNQQLGFPPQEAFHAEWLILQNELSATPPPASEVELLQARVTELENALIDLLIGGV